MESVNDLPPSVFTTRAHAHNSGHRSVPPANALGHQHVFPSYPSSTLHHYYPSSYDTANYAHISTSQPFTHNIPQSVVPDFHHMPLPSASQSHIPSLRHSPPFPSLENIRSHHAPDPNFSDHRNNANSRNSQRIHSASPITSRSHHSVPFIAAPQPIPLPPNPVLSPLEGLPRSPLPHSPLNHAPFPHAHLPYPHFPHAPFQNVPHYHPPFPLNIPNHTNAQVSLVNSSLPSTKDVPLLTGKHDWGPWHSSVRTLIINANLLGHIADDPLPGALFDPGLWPTYPPSIHRWSTQNELRSFAEWWSRDGLASHILTSRLSSSVLGSLPVANERMGLRRSARAVYLNLRHHYGAGDYSAVMVIEARLRQLRCLPSRGGVRVADFITTWRSSINQMEAAGFLPGLRHLLSMFADGLPNSTVAYINLIDHIISSLNEPHEQSLPSLQQLFDRTIHIENNIQRTRILQPSTRRTQPVVPSTSAPNQSLSTANTPAIPAGTQNTLPARSGAPLHCSNCGRDGHTDRTCFQPGGAMEGRREEYLASRVPKPIAHIAEVLENEDNQIDVEEGTVVVEDNTLHNEFAAMSLSAPNDIHFSTYALPTFSDISTAQAFALSSVSQGFNSALDSACTNHIFRDREIFHTYNIDGAVPVKTANCGFLQTLGLGDVKVKLTIGQRTIVWTLRNCLHAPDIPINLLSVGALQEHHMSVAFSFQKTTISFPLDHPQLSGISFDAHVTRRLSLLSLDFVPPPTLPVALYLFPIPQPSPELWHRRFGHLGHEASKNMINGNYATGIIKPVTPYPLTHRCIPCIIGKCPQAPYSHNAKRASDVGELVHIDTCGPFPTLTPKKEAYFTIFLDDASNYGVTTLLSNKSDAFQAWKKVEASWELLSGNRIKTVRFDGAKEFTQGSFSAHLVNRGIAMQVTAPYAHSQAGKAERYVRTIEDGVQSLLADAKLPPSFWGDAALTTQYLRNRLPTSTLPIDKTPYEIMHGVKPDISHLRVWGCQCFPAIPPELRIKGGPRRYEAIFVGYEDNRIGWRVRDLSGKYHFSRDIVFNESTPGHLSPTRGTLINHALLPPPSVLSIPSSPSNTKGTVSVPQSTSTPLPSPTLANILHNRDLITRSTRSTTNSLPKPTRHYNDIEPVGLLISLNAALNITPPSTPDLTTSHTSLLHDCFLSAPLPFLRNRSWDLNKPPNSYHEAVNRPDNPVWLAAMQREFDSLEDRKAFERTTLPHGRKAVGVRWTYDYKYNPDGSIIRGKEKARLVAQGFSQRPEDYGETYAPVVKLNSVRILLSFANQYDLEIMSFDVKTAFLHARLPYDIFVKQIPGYPEADNSTVLRLLVALYGLKQASYEWYKLLSSILAALGLLRSEADHAVFVGRWTSPPHSSVSLPPSGGPLFLVVPIHVDDGLAISNSLPLYNWFVSEISKSIQFVCLGPVINTRYLGHRIVRDRNNKTIKLSQADLILSLLEDWGLLENCKTSNVPLHHNPSNLPPCSPNACSEIPDDKILVSYQRLVGSLTYLAICTRPDIAYAAMALGQFNASPTRSHLACAKGVLRYLAGTVHICLQFPSPSFRHSSRSQLPSTCGFSDADWASDEKDRKSISGYCFYFLGSLVSWSSRKQRTVSTSSTESEYYALTNTIKEAIWMKLFLTLTELPSPSPLPIFCDNQSTCTIANTDAISSRTKHIDVRHHFIRQHLTDGSFVTTWITTSDMVADIFTKPLLSTLFLRHRDSLGLLFS